MDGFLIRHEVEAGDWRGTFGGVRQKVKNPQIKKNSASHNENATQNFGISACVISSAIEFNILHLWTQIRYTRGV